MVAAEAEKHPDGNGRLDSGMHPDAATGQTGNAIAVYRFTGSTVEFLRQDPGVLSL